MKQKCDGKENRSIWDAEKEDYHFSVVDVIETLTDSNIPKRYWTDLKRKLIDEGSKLYEKIVRLKMRVQDGKMRETDTLDTKGILIFIGKDIENGKNNMIIKNKIESVKKINELGLNKFPEQIFAKDDLEGIKEFIEKNPAYYYAIRDKSKPGGVFKLKVAADKVLNEIDGYNLFSINVSSANYVDNQLLVGEIEFLSNGEVYAILSLNPAASVRDAIKKPDFNLKTTIFDKKLSRIPHFDYIYKYISDNNLYDIIVEFALFDKEVGEKKEKVIVYELRTNY